MRVSERYPILVPSMYGIFTYIWLMFMVNVGKYASPRDPIWMRLFLWFSKSCCLMTYMGFQFQATWWGALDFEPDRIPKKSVWPSGFGNKFCTEKMSSLILIQNNLSNINVPNIRIPSLHWVVGIVFLLALRKSSCWMWFVTLGHDNSSGTLETSLGSICNGRSS